jgi:hypothetical protein
MCSGEEMAVRAAAEAAKRICFARSVKKSQIPNACALLTEALVTASSVEWEGDVALY